MKSACSLLILICFWGKSRIFQTMLGPGGCYSNPTHCLSLTRKKKREKKQSNKHALYLDKNKSGDYQVKQRKKKKYKAEKTGHSLMNLKLNFMLRHHHHMCSFSPPISVYTSYDLCSHIRIYYGRGKKHRTFIRPRCERRQLHVWRWRRLRGSSLRPTCSLVPLVSPYTLNSLKSQPDDESWNRCAASHDMRQQSEQAIKPRLQFQVALFADFIWVATCVRVHEQKIKTLVGPEKKFKPERTAVEVP